jgi:hypothetical protein
MCWTLNHQNILEMALGHISLSAAPAYSSVVPRRGLRGLAPPFTQRVPARVAPRVR